MKICTKGYYTQNWIAKDEHSRLKLDKNKTLKNETNSVVFFWYIIYLCNRWCLSHSFHNKYLCIGCNLVAVHWLYRHTGQRNPENTRITYHQKKEKSDVNRARRVPEKRTACGNLTILLLDQRPNATGANFSINLTHLSLSIDDCWINSKPFIFVHWILKN